MTKRLYAYAAALALASMVIAGVDANAQFKRTPALKRVSARSPFADCDVVLGDGEVSYLNTEIGPSVATNPLDWNNVVGVWQQDRLQLIGARGLVTGTSHNGGRTWKRTFAHFSRCSGGNATNGGDYERATDPWISFSPNGSTVQQISLSLDISDAFEAILVSRSANSGDAWGEPITLLRDTDPKVFDDQPSITADLNDSNFAYAAWDRIDTNVVSNRGPTWFARTTDGGATWEPARIIYDPGTDASTIANQIVTLPNGELVNFFARFTNQTDPGPGDSVIAVIRSQDKGLTWSQPIVINTLRSIGVTDVKTGEGLRTGDIIPDIAADQTTGTLYAVWQDARFSGGLRDGIALSKSTDGGLTWSAPMQVNQAPNVQAFTASVDVADDGTVGVTYYDFRRDTKNPKVLLTNYWEIISSDGGATWREAQLGSRFNMRRAPKDALGFFVGDYEGLTHAGDAFVPMFVRTNAARSNRTDVFSVRVPKAVGDANTVDVLETGNDDRVEINANPLPLQQRVAARRQIRRAR